MPTIQIDNSFSKLIDFSEETYKKVKTALTYTDFSVAREKESLWHAIKKAAVKRQFKYVAMLKKRIEELGPDKICWLKDDEFPTGLLNVVAKAIEPESFSIKDLRKVPEQQHIFRWNNKPSELRYYQKEAVDAFMNIHRGVISAAVGSGKTRQAVEIIKQLGVNTLFVTPSSALLTQTHGVLELSFGAKNVQIVKTDDIKKDKMLKPIRVITIQTLASLQKNKLAHKVLSDVDFIILDEVHHGGASSYTDLLPLLKNVYYRLGLSGTYTRNDSKILDLWGLAGDVVYEYSAKRATEEGFLTPVEFNIVKLRGKISNNYQTEYRDNYGGMELIDMIHRIITLKIPNDKQVLVLVDRKDRCGNLIYEHLKEQGVPCTYVTGDNTKQEIKDAIEGFNSKEIRVLIGSSIFGEGCDILSTDALIMAKGGKSEITFTQAVGRAVRLYPGKKIAMVWDFNFSYCRYLSKHTKLRIKTYEKQFEGKINHIDFI